MPVSPCDGRLFNDLTTSGGNSQAGSKNSGESVPQREGKSESPENHRTKAKQGHWLKTVNANPFLKILCGRGQTLLENVGSDTSKTERPKWSGNF